MCMVFAVVCLVVAPLIIPGMYHIGGWFERRRNRRYGREEW